MKNKGFTLVEILAVVVILSILITMASIGVTRYRRDVDKKDLLNLHSSIETSYINYRAVLAMKGDVVSNVITIDNNTPSDFNKYLEDLSYNGKRLNKNDLNGSTITLATKGAVLSNSEYYAKGEEQFIKDATCMVEGSIDTTDADNPKTVNKCKRNSVTNEYEPSKDELICLKIKYNDSMIIDDYDDSLSFNKLCTYLG